jgi:proteic killer suppression protein
VIVSFQGKLAAMVFHGERPRRFPVELARNARRKLEMIDKAERLTDLLEPPGNRLEALRGDCAGQHSIRINDQWRVCFAWRDDDAHDVEIVDYH